MTIDLSGGLPESYESFLTDAPSNPELREATNVWIHDDQGRFAMPRLGVERVGSDWRHPAVLSNVAFSDGRVLFGSTVGEAHSTMDDRGRPAILGSGPIALKCVEPFHRWTLDYAGQALDTNVADQARGILATGPYVDVRVQAELEMVVPPWFDPDSESKPRGIDTGMRFEQLFRARGTLGVGREEFQFTGSGLRIRRRLMRRMETFAGHTWQSAVFPSGRAFGYLAFPDAEGMPTYRRGFVFDGSRMMPAAPVDIPWVSNFSAGGEDVSCRLDTDTGPVRISGTSTTSAVTAGSKALAAVKGLASFTAARNLFLHQGGARYEWDGEVVYGMIERALVLDQVTVQEGIEPSGS